MDLQSEGQIPKTWKPALQMVCQNTLQQHLQEKRKSESKNTL